MPGVLFYHVWWSARPCSVFHDEQKSMPIRVRERMVMFFFLVLVIGMFATRRGREALSEGCAEGCLEAIFGGFLGGG